MMLAGTSWGATWTVAKDGSGDFTVIQDAVNAAADGDVIEIGPGRYEEYHVYANDNSGTCVRVWNKSLSFIGSGPTETIIGLENATGHPRIVGIRPWNSQSIHVENLGFYAQWGKGLHLEVPEIEVENCEFLGDHPQQHTDGIVAMDIEKGYIRNCRFYNLRQDIGLFSPVRGLVIEDCEFSGFQYGISAGYANTHFIVRNSTFDGEWALNAVGVWIWDGARIDMSGCTITRCTAEAAFDQNGPSVVRDCVLEYVDGPEGFRDGAVYLHARHQVLFENNIITSDFVCFAIISNGLPGASAFHNNHILVLGDGLYLKGEDPSGYMYPGEILNMENNYWGTTDEEEIAARIIDGNDNPDIEFTVDFLPLADGPVPTERIALDGVKALYR
ncbi:hypothetical protein CSB20_01130 [bacterium DOLZORAL124_64_63]|nr:MAG: hypothetical protein CSB20_01130 [bacterium DOLZORAL124_64_63]